MTFAGSGWITVPNLAISGTFSVEAWVKATNSSATYAIVGSNTSGFTLKLTPEDSTTGAMIHTNIGSGTAALNSTADAKFAWKPGVWYHIAETVIGGTAGSYQIYVDGVQVGSGVFSGTPVLADSTHTLTIGANGEGGGYKLKGTLDEVAVYSGALSPQAVAAHYAEGAAAVNNDVRSLYDAAGNPTSVSDNTFLANADFEAGTTAAGAGWALGSKAALYTATSGNDANVHKGTESLESHLRRRDLHWRDPDRPDGPRPGLPIPDLGPGCLRRSRRLQGRGRQRDDLDDPQDGFAHAQFMDSVRGRKPCSGQLRRTPADHDLERLVVRHRLRG